MLDLVAVAAFTPLVPHPSGSDPLLKFIQEERRDFSVESDELRGSSDVPNDVWARMVPWAYHDGNGDLCFLLPPLEEGTAVAQDEDRTVAIAYRHCPEFQIFPGGVTLFLERLLGEGRMPRGWPARQALWRSIEGSPVV
ncbi:hypothetical protein [Streptomyces sp. NPDC051569]|uniref:hypothetical protein n=1 Tax=Streptomyces sp. NPDC051569 TaxID=3365661 RepID=UPI0037BB52F4